MYFKSTSQARSQNTFHVEALFQIGDLETTMRPLMDYGRSDGSDLEAKSLETNEFNRFQGHFSTL